MAFGNPYYPQQPYYGGYGASQPLADNLQQLRMQYQQPMQMQQPSPQAQPVSSSAPIWVQGEAGAKAYRVEPGSCVLLMDSENSCFYLKSSDMTGMPSMRIFDYVERGAAPHTMPQIQQQAAPVMMGDFVPRTEFDQLKAQVAELLTKRRPTKAEKEDVTDEKPAV